VVEHSANLPYISFLLSQDSGLMIYAINNVFIDEEFINRHIDMFHECMDQVNIYDSCNELITRIILQRAEFNKWANMSVEFLPLDIIMLMHANLSFALAHRNKQILTEHYDIIPFNAFQLSDLYENDKLSEEFIAKNILYMRWFNPNNNLSIEFIIKNVSRINMNCVHNWKMPLVVADAICKYTLSINIDRLFNNYASTATIAFIQNKHIPMEISLTMYDHCVNHNIKINYELITRYEFIDRHMHLFHMFKEIPFDIYKKYNIKINDFSI
jgi:hypothetical protein